MKARHALPFFSSEDHRRPQILLTLNRHQIMLCFVLKLLYSNSIALFST